MSTEARTNSTFPVRLESISTPRHANDYTTNEVEYIETAIPAIAGLDSSLSLRDFVHKLLQFLLCVVFPFIVEKGAVDARGAQRFL